jgi:hypothetical protein
VFSRVFKGKILKLPVIVNSFVGVVDGEDFDSL